MVEHQVQWMAPSPIWAETSTSSDPFVRESFSRPAILRFTTDTFMDDFLSMLEKDPKQLPQLVARYETWREPVQPSTEITGVQTTLPVPKLVRKLERLRLVKSRAGNGAGNGTTQENGKMLKLYQPAHQRYYLVTTCLVCGITGMPDRRIDAGREEKGSFVIRRLFPPTVKGATTETPPFDATTWEEHAFVATADGSVWKNIGTMSEAEVEKLQSGEERLPLFGVTCSEDDGRPRRICAGLIPVGKREAYLAAPAQSSEKDARQVLQPLKKTQRKIHFRSQVAEPWKNVIDQAERFGETLYSMEHPTTDSKPTDVQIQSFLKGAREQIQTQSWFVLFDFAQYLADHVKDVWNVVSGEAQEGDLKETAQKNLLSALKDTKITEEEASLAQSLYPTWPIKASLFEALKAIAEDKEGKEKNKLESAWGSFDVGTWPSFLFPLADPKVTALKISDDAGPLTSDDEVDVEEEQIVEQSPPGTLADVADQKKRIDGLVALVVRALPEKSEKPVPPIPLAAQQVTDMRDGIFVIRAIFERPNCTPFRSTVVSGATVPFNMAGFFDPDAPARPIRIALPIDTSPGGLRKFDKNTAFMISDVLCGQIQRAKGLSLGDLVLSVLPWPFHKDLSVPDTGPCKTDASLQLGMICSLSIPIITICALILLMIIVNLLDFIFRWIPYFIMCFPLPGFKAKKG